MAGRETPAGTRIRAAIASLCLTDAAPPAGLESVFGRPEAVHALRRMPRLKHFNRAGELDAWLTGLLDKTARSAYTPAHPDDPSARQP